MEQIYKHHKRKINSILALTCDLLSLIFSSIGLKTLWILTGHWFGLGQVLGQNNPPNISNKTIYKKKQT